VGRGGARGAEQWSVADPGHHEQRQRTFRRAHGRAVVVGSGRRPGPKLPRRLARAGADSRQLNSAETQMKRIACSWTLFLVALLAACTKSGDSSNAAGAGGGRKITVALMPKSKGNAYFVSCRQGAEAAAKELGVDLIFDGPTTPDPA